MASTIESARPEIPRRGRPHPLRRIREHVDQVTRESAGLPLVDTGRIAVGPHIDAQTRAHVLSQRATEAGVVSPFDAQVAEVSGRANRDRQLGYERFMPKVHRREVQAPTVGAIAVEGGDDESQHIPVTVVGSTTPANRWGDTTADVLRMTPHLEALDDTQLTEANQEADQPPNPEA